VLSSKGDAKHEARFAARIDVLAERVDTLASTVATTASAIAKKDGEIASLQRELQVRDEQLKALAARAAQPGGHDPRELQELRQSVAALASERGKHGGSSKQLDDLSAKVGLLGQRLETLSATVSTTAAGLAGREGELAAIRKRLEQPAPAGSGAAPTDPGMKQQLDELAANAVRTKLRLDGQATELGAVKAQLAEPHAPSDELREMLTTLRSRVEALAGLHAGVTEAELDERLAPTSAALDLLGKRVDELAEGIETTTAGLAEKERELAELHRHFLESSSRVESIVDDLRDALAAFPEVGTDALATLTAQVESAVKGVSAVTDRVDRLESVRTQDLVTELAARIELVDDRVASASAEIARAKTLWPIALRSLEARLDDVAPRPAEETTGAESAPIIHEPGEPTPAPREDAAEDLLAGLRDSLRAMENVAAELERSSESPSGEDASEAPSSQQAIAAGARIVPLRTADP
jgi:chromosome segregation ATPase